MKSTLILAVRAAVVVGCMIAVPAAALIGSGVTEWSLRRSGVRPRVAEMAEAVADSPLPWNSPADKPASPSQSLSAAPVFDPLAAGATPPPAVLGGDSAGAVDSAERLASFESAGEKQTAAEAAHAAPPSPGAWFDEAAAKTASAVPDPDVSRPAPRTEFASLEQRLRALGAVHYRLETWGDEGFYRFQCAVALAPGAAATRHFEAVGPAALETVERVAGEIEAWRLAAGR